MSKSAYTCVNMDHSFKLQSSVSSLSSFFWFNSWSRFQYFTSKKWLLCSVSVGPRRPALLPLGVGAPLHWCCESFDCVGSSSSSSIPAGLQRVGLELLLTGRKEQLICNMCCVQPSCFFHWQLPSNSSTVSQYRRISPDRNHCIRNVIHVKIWSDIILYCHIWTFLNIWWCMSSSNWYDHMYTFVSIYEYMHIYV